MQARQELEQKCLYMAEDIADELSYALNDLINEIICEFEKAFTDKLQVSRGNATQRIETITQLKALADGYNMLYLKLGGNK